MPGPSCFRHTALREAARRFFDLKLAWPFRSDAATVLENTVSTGRTIPSWSSTTRHLGCDKSRFDRIFLSLQSTFKHREEVKKAEDLIGQHLKDVVDRYKELADYH